MRTRYVLSVSGRGSAGLPVAVSNPSPEQWRKKEQAILEKFHLERNKLSRVYSGAAGSPMYRRKVDHLERERDSKLARLRQARSAALESYETPLFDRANVTDRALRYRANQDPPEGPRVCCYCGSTDHVEIDHVNGFEEDTSPENLVWACRRCNTLKGVSFANQGRGRRTAQFNPTKFGGAATVGEWIRAVGSIIPHKGAQYAGANYGLAEAMPVGEAVAMIRATPQYKRSEYAGQLRKHRAGRRRAEEVPF